MAIIFNPSSFLTTIDENEGLAHIGGLNVLGSFSGYPAYPEATLNIEQKVKGGYIWSITIREYAIPKNWRVAQIDEMPAVLAEKRFGTYRQTDVERAKPRFYAGVIDSMLSEFFKERVTIPDKIAVLLQRTLRPDA